MNQIYNNRIRAFCSIGVPPIQESRRACLPALHFFRFDIKFTVDKMPWTPEIHRHYYVSCELENQRLNLGGVGEDDSGWFVYQVLYKGGRLYPFIQDVKSYKDGMSVLISSEQLYYWIASVKDGLVGVHIL